MSDEKDKEILIPEVLPPVRGEQRRSAWREEPRGAEAQVRGSWLDGAANLFGPIVSGALLDAVHMRPAMGAMRLLAAVLGFWFARVCGLRMGMCFMIALVSAFYTTNGKFLPIATLAGLYFGLRGLKARRKR